MEDDSLWVATNTNAINYIVNGKIKTLAQKQIDAQQQQIDLLKKDQHQLQEQIAELKKMMEKILK